MATFNPAFGAEDPLGADALAMGSSAIALSRSNAVTAVNPGLLGLEQRYDFEGSFVYGPGKGTHWMGAAVDGRTSSAVGLGFIYSGDVYETAPRTPELPGWTESGEDIENVKRFHDFTLGMAIPMFQRRLALGFNGNLSLANHDLAGKSTDGNGDVGLAARPVDGVTLGVTANNVLPIETTERPLSTVAGLRLAAERAGAVQGEVGYAPSTDALEGAFGAELMPGAGRIRAGYRSSEAGSVLTWGLAVHEEGAELAYAMSLPLQGDILGGMLNQIMFRFSVPEDLL